MYEFFNETDKLFVLFTVYQKKSYCVFVLYEML